jgi:DNA-binding NarL/FixJ family response regulator
MSPIKILLADDHALFMGGLQALLQQEPDFQIVATVRDGQSAIAYLDANAVDLAILDINMPQMSGLDVCRYFIGRENGPRLLLLSMYAEPSLVRSAIDNGAHGYMLKTADVDELVFAIRQVQKGKSYFETALLLPSNKVDEKPGASSAPSSALTDLTSREVEILAMIANGLSNNEIGERLYISPKTVDTHRTNLMRKLNARNAASLTRIAVEAGLIQ